MLLPNPYHPLNFLALFTIKPVNPPSTTIIRVKPKILGLNLNNFLNLNKQNYFNPP